MEQYLNQIDCIRTRHCLASYDSQTGEKITDDERAAAKKAIIEGGYATEYPDGRMFLTRKGLQLWTNGR